MSLGQDSHTLSGCVCQNKHYRLLQPAYCGGTSSQLLNKNAINKNIFLVLIHITQYGKCTQNDLVFSVMLILITLLGKMSTQQFCVCQDMTHTSTVILLIQYCLITVNYFLIKPGKPVIESNSKMKLSLWETTKEDIGHTLVMHQCVLKHNRACSFP